MAEFFKPYEGTLPYYFISYSHRDSQLVLDTITQLREKNYRLWYDEGIPAGSDWPQNIQQHMEGCTAVLFFQSHTALASANCYNEIKTAHDLNKQIYCIRLDDSQLVKPWTESMENASYVLCGARAELLAEAIVQQCAGETFLGTQADYEDSSRSRGSRSFWDILLAVLVLLAVGFGAYAFWQSRSSAITEPQIRVIRKQTVQQAADIDLGQWADVLRSSMVFPDEQQENAIRDRLENYQEQVSAEQLVEITQLSFCGSKSLKSGVQNVRFENGQWTLSGIALPCGKVQDLSLIGKMPYLEQLDLVYQPVSDLSALKDLIALRELNLAGCEAVDISTLPQLQSLEVLALEHSAVRDLTALAQQPSLTTVTVSADMFPMKLDGNAGYDVVLVP